MENCISKIYKDRFFAYENEMKNGILFLKGKVRRAVEMGTKGGTHVGVHSLLRFSDIMVLAPIQTGSW